MREIMIVYDDVELVAYKILFSLTKYPQPIPQLTREVYGDDRKLTVKRFCGQIQNLRNARGWSIERSGGNASLSDGHIRLLNDYVKYVLNGDLSNATHCSTIESIKEEVRKARHGRKNGI